MQFVNFYWIMFIIFGCHSIHIQKTKKINYRLIAVVWSFKKSENQSSKSCKVFHTNIGYYCISSHGNKKALVPFYHKKCFS